MISIYYDSLYIFIIDPYKHVLIEHITPSLVSAYKSHFILHGYILDSNSINMIICTMHYATCKM